jgi:hypothetical protein
VGVNPTTAKLTHLLEKSETEIFAHKPAIKRASRINIIESDDDEIKGPGTSLPFIFCHYCHFPMADTSKGSGAAVEDSESAESNTDPHDSDSEVQSEEDEFLGRLALQPTKLRNQLMSEVRARYLLMLSIVILSFHQRPMVNTVDKPLSRAKGLARTPLSKSPTKRRETASAPATAPIRPSQATTKVKHVTYNTYPLTTI